MVLARYAAGPEKGDTPEKGDIPIYSKILKRRDADFSLTAAKALSFFTFLPLFVSNLGFRISDLKSKRCSTHRDSPIQGHLATAHPVCRSPPMQITTPLTGTPTTATHQTTATATTQSAATPATPSTGSGFEILRGAVTNPFAPSSPIPPDDAKSDMDHAQQLFNMMSQMLKDTTTKDRNAIGNIG